MIDALKKVLAHKSNDYVITTKYMQKTNKQSTNNLLSSENTI